MPDSAYLPGPTRNAFGGYDIPDTQVLQSAGGYYLGTLYRAPDLGGWYPNERSSGYFSTRALAEHALGPGPGQGDAAPERQRVAYERLVDALLCSTHTSALVKNWLRQAVARIDTYPLPTQVSLVNEPGLGYVIPYPVDLYDPFRPEDRCGSCDTPIGHLGPDESPRCPACRHH
jgi:hypothetical protein